MSSRSFASLRSALDDKSGESLEDKIREEKKTPGNSVYSVVNEKSVRQLLIEQSMNEVTSAFRPHEVSLCLQLAFRGVILEVAVLR